MFRCDQSFLDRFFTYSLDVDSAAMIEVLALVPAGGDTDGDGLPDAQEAEIGSDPTLSDTDGDGLAVNVTSPSTELYAPAERSRSATATFIHSSKPTLIDWPT